MNLRTKITAVAAILFLGGAALVAAGCTSSDADVVSKNLSKDADNFKVARRIVFINGITDKYILEVEGYCSLGNDDPPRELSVTCKSEGGYKKHFLGLSDNVTYLVEQIDPVGVSANHYKIIFKPESIIPTPEVR